MSSKRANLTLTAFFLQVVKDIKVTQDPVGHLVPREYQDRQGLKVLKGNQVHQDQDPKDLQERRCHTHTTIWPLIGYPYMQMKFYYILPLHSSPVLYSHDSLSSLFFSTFKWWVSIFTSDRKEHKMINKRHLLHTSNVPSFVFAGCCFICYV